MSVTLVGVRAALEQLVDAKTGQSISALVKDTQIQIAGLPGLLVATVSMVLPAAILAFAVGRIANQVAGSAGFKLAQNALVPLAIGLLIAGGLDLAIAATRELGG